jgi:formyl-CoA transferase
VLEVAAWTFVPAAGAILADLGADVIKVEPPNGDPQRGLKNMLNFASAGPNPFNEIPNRGKRSITLDLKNEAGREALLQIAKESDVFLTSYLPELREKLRVDVPDIKAANPKIIYVRGTGWGSQAQIEPNGFLPSVTGQDGVEFRLVSPPMHFDEEPTRPAGPAPELGQHTETVLTDVGLDWDAITSLRERGGLG